MRGIPWPGSSGASHPERERGPEDLEPREPRQEDDGGNLSGPGGKQRTTHALEREVLPLAEGSEKKPREKEKQPEPRRLSRPREQEAREHREEPEQGEAKDLQPEHETGMLRGAFSE